MPEVDWWSRAQAVLPGGVNSPVRSFGRVGGAPFFVERGEGAELVAVDGRRWIDYVMSWGALILGHAHPDVVAATQAAVARGLSFGAPTPDEVRLAERIVAALPSVEMVRMVNSGTEATMSALRVARAVTGRDVVVKFTGCYHGHHDSLLVRAGSGAATFGVPDSAGVPAAWARLTLSLPYNDVEAVTDVFRREGARIAAVIVEPVAGNMGTVLPRPGFLETLRERTREAGALLIFDEVMTGFRVAWGGAQRRYGIDPDLTCLGKVIGGGMPVAAYGGRAEYLRRVAPLGPVYQAGTLSGNPVGMAAGLAQLEAIGGPAFYPPLEDLATALADGLVERARRHRVPLASAVAGGMVSVFFADRAPTRFEEVEATDHGRFRRFFHALLERGVFWPPSPYESAFVSRAHTPEMVEATLAAADAAFAGL
ncbi:MAG: glutamate-1-semialdehyde 2,1-aminomutase [Actinomycetia bacterium]|nr:glutamate-1-semialdehyde 2,1-aminomutase [Actinomycetes bacterium]